MDRFSYTEEELNMIPEKRGVNAMSKTFMWPGVPDKLGEGIQKQQERHAAVSRNIEGLKRYKEEEKPIAVMSQRKSKELQSRQKALQTLDKKAPEKITPSFKVSEKRAKRIAQLRAFIHVKQIEIKALNAVMRQFRNNLVMKQASLSLLEEQFHNLQREEKV